MKNPFNSGKNDEKINEEINENTEVAVDEQPEITEQEAVETEKSEIEESSIILPFNIPSIPFKPAKTLLKLPKVLFASNNPTTLELITEVGPPDWAIIQFDIKRPPYLIHYNYKYSILFNKNNTLFINIQQNSN